MTQRKLQTMEQQLYAIIKKELVEKKVYDKKVREIRELNKQISAIQEQIAGIKQEMGQLTYKPGKSWAYTLCDAFVEDMRDTVKADLKAGK